jgi:hypothetical protein
MAHRSPPFQGDEVQSHDTRDSAGPLPIRDVGSEATRHVEALEPTLAGRQGLMLQGTWQRVGACPTPCLGLKIVCRGTRSAGYRQFSMSLYVFLSLSYV